MLDEMFGGDKEITEQLFELYLADNSEIHLTLLQQYETQDFNALYHTSHTLSGALGNLCEMDILAGIKEIEAASKQEVLPKKETLNQVTAGLVKISEQMTAYLTN